MRKLALLLLLSAPFFSAAQADSLAFFRNIFTDTTRLQQWLRSNHIPALGVGIITNGKLERVKVFGTLQPGRPAPADALFNVASLTKPVAAIVALKLVSQGRWKLDEPLHTYWTDPDIAGDPRSRLLTTRHVLSHQTGFPNWRYSQPGQKLAFQFDPGTKYQYSGEGFEYLRRALEQKFKKGLDELAAELVFRPAGMKDTRFFWDAGMEESRFAQGVDAAGKGYAPNKTTGPNAADDLVTTIEDYGRFLLSVLNRKGLSKKVYNEMVAHQVATARGKHFGLGFERYDFGDGTYALSHGGSDVGVKTLFFLLPGKGQGLIIFTNADNGYKVYEPLLTHYLGDYGKQIVAIETKQ